jgi:UDP-3-O-[3-hydroxymyristoyl] glucosamine N-acyltransferase
VRNLDKLRERIKMLEAAVAAGAKPDNTPDSTSGEQ